MTNQEAIKILNDSEADMDYSYADIMKAHCMGVQALEKQIPKKPIISKSNEEWGTDIDFICPYCETPLDTEKQARCCDECGQCVSWEVELEGGVSNE